MEPDVSVTPRRARFKCGARVKAEVSPEGGEGRTWRSCHAADFAVRAAGLEACSTRAIGFVLVAALFAGGGDGGVDVGFQAGETGAGDLLLVAVEAGTDFGDVDERGDVAGFLFKDGLAEDTIVLEL